MNKNNAIAILILILFVVSYFFPVWALAADLDFLTLKYGSLGNLLLAVKNDNAGGYETSEAVVSDPSTGDIYVAGATSPSGGTDGINPSTDGYIVKYDSSGNMEWSKQDILSGLNYWHSIAIDSSRGAIYVTGFSVDFGVVTVRYDLAGNEVWKVFNAAGDSTGGVAVDQSDGDIYISGANSTGDLLNPYDSFVIKYKGLDGSVIWQEISDKGTHETFHGIAVDSISQNVYAAGTVNGDFVIVKYDKSGLEKNSVLRNFVGNDWGEGIAVQESTNDIYLTGGSFAGGTYRFTTIKYNNSLSEKWLKSYDIGAVYGYPHSLAFDADKEKIYVAGYFWNGLDYDFRTIKYDSAGTELWNKVYDSGFKDEAFGASVDSDSGEIYVTGVTEGPIANNSPTVSSLMTNANTIDYCKKSPNDIILAWQFADTEDLGTQTAYRLKITRSDLRAYDSGQVTGALGKNTSVFAADINNNPANCSGSCSGFIDYGSYSYTWNVEVWDSGGASDGPVTGGNFNTPKHQYPDVGFAPPPPGNAAVVNIPVTFKATGNGALNDSVCYGSGAPCKNYDWDFCSTGNCTIDRLGTNETTSHTYITQDSFYIVLTVTDQDDYVCSNSGPKILGVKPANWKEVIPISE